MKIESLPEGTTSIMRREESEEGNGSQPKY
jgi:hypothetical protein